MRKTALLLSLAVASLPAAFGQKAGTQSGTSARGGSNSSMGLSGSQVMRNQSGAVAGSPGSQINSRINNGINKATGTANRSMSDAAGRISGSTQKTTGSTRDAERSHTNAPN
jgi:hypothetical protein